MTSNIEQYDDVTQIHIGVFSMPRFFKPSLSGGLKDGDTEASSRRSFLTEL